MKYDKQNIRDADKQGIFDSSFDSRVLEMDGEEKRELSRRLQESSETVPDTPTVFSDKEDTPDKNAISRLSLWERFVFFIHAHILTPATQYFSYPENASTSR